MLNKATTLTSDTLHSRDGEIGSVKDFYFDDRHWTIRYLVAETGSWLTDRQVLISPHALVSVKPQERSISVALTQKQIEDSPALGSDKPVSRQFEDTYHRYYGWPIYWGGPFMWGTGYYPFVMNDAAQGAAFAQGAGPSGVGASPGGEPNPDASGKTVEDETPSDPHLRSTQEVSGYHIEAEDGPIGHIEDFVIDDETWAIRYLIVDTVNWWPGKKVLIAARWIERVSWDESKVFITLSRAAIKQSPEYTEDAPLTRDYEVALHGHYNRQGYWVDES